MCRSHFHRDAASKHVTKSTCENLQFCDASREITLMISSQRVHMKITRLHDARHKYNRIIFLDAKVTPNQCAIL